MSSKKAKPKARAQKKWTDAERAVILRSFVETGSLHETRRRTGVPVGTLARWLDDPRTAADLERIGTAFAREVSQDDQAAAREAAAALRKSVGKCHARLERADRLTTKALAVLTRTLLSCRVELHRLGRLEEGLPTENLAVVPTQAAALRQELADLLKRKPRLRALFGK